ncbi:MAG: T9SS type A sorting domain-containing protein [Bacteroidales bacterium]|jgi:hypothetical protein|nr:T9SS type A sorting domain-containing protein [Bacteroidales bacterium]
MKKLALFIALTALTFGIKAQSFRITTADGTEIVNNHTFILNAADGGVRTEYIHFTNITSNPISVRVQIEKISLGPDADIFMCFAGTCLTDTLAPEANTATIGAGEEYTEFDLQYTYSTMNMSEVKVNLLNADDLSLIQSFTIFYAQTNGLNDAIETAKQASFNIYPNPADSKATIAYNLPSSCSNVRLIVKNMLGKEVANIKLDGSRSGKTSINTSSLPVGIYFCSIVCNEDAIVTKKMIVKH